MNSALVGVIRLFPNDKEYYVVVPTKPSRQNSGGIIICQPWNDYMCELEAIRTGTRIVDYSLCNFAYTLNNLFEAKTPIIVPFSHSYECDS